MIIITRTFFKELKNFDSFIHTEIASLIYKYARGLSKNLLLLKKEGDLIILLGIVSKYYFYQYNGLGVHTLISSIISYQPSEHSRK